MRSPKKNTIATLIVDLFGEAISTVIGLLYFGGFVITIVVGYLQFGALGLIIGVLFFAALGIPLVKLLHKLDS